MKVFVYSADEAFIKMLSLELSELGAECVCSGDVETADFILADAKAVIGGVRLPEDGQPSLIFGYPEELSALPEKALLLSGAMERPFSTEALLEAVFGEPAKDIRARALSTVGRCGSPADALVINRITRSVYCHGESVELSRREYDLLLFLCDNRGRTLSRDEIRDNVWGGSFSDKTNIVDVYVRYLRKKLDERFGFELISSARGTGYTVKKTH